MGGRRARVDTPPFRPINGIAIDARSLLSSVVDTDGEEGERDSSLALAAVVFLVGQDTDGSEGLASLASSGKIPGVKGRYLTAEEVHQHVQGMESAHTVAQFAHGGGRGSGARVVAEVSLEEFQHKWP